MLAVDPHEKNAFVIWIDPSEGSAGTAEYYRGRVEHVSTSTRARFSSKEELLDFLESHQLSPSGPRGDDDADGAR